jgi:hypothetical protein
MKKTLIAAIVGGIVLFMWQFLSWTIINLHGSSQQYTPKQDSILQMLQSNLDKEGGYYLPSAPPGTSFEGMEKLAAENLGKPWASVQYHAALEYNMGMNMTRGLIANIFIIWLLCWILAKIANNNFTTTFTATLFVGIIVYLNSSYTGHIWYPMFDIRAYLIDAIVSWGLVGAWLGWWMNRSQK